MNMIDGDGINHDMVSQDNRIACPTTGAVCPTRMRIVTDYTGNWEHALEHAKDMDPNSPFNPLLDERKMQKRLLEQYGHAMGSACTGPEVGVCPVGYESHSQEHTGIVDSIKVAISKVRGNR